LKWQVLEKCKPIFAGNEQHDAQEFLAELMDMLHEEVNRVLVKPYIAAPPDEEWEAMGLQVRRPMCRRNITMTCCFVSATSSEFLETPFDAQSFCFGRFVSRANLIGSYLWCLSTCVKVRMCLILELCGR
jgi:hypothetical protein